MVSHWILYFFLIPILQVPVKFESVTIQCCWIIIVIIVPTAIYIKLLGRVCHLELAAGLKTGRFERKACGFVTCEPERYFCCNQHRVHWL